MNSEHTEGTPFWRSPIGLALCGFLAIAIFFIALEHRAHLLGLWPLLFLLACGGMHFFMHRGHGGHGHGQLPSNKRGDDER